MPILRLLLCICLCLLGAVAAATGASTATTPDITLSVDELTASEVFYVNGATPDGDDRERLQASADDLDAKGYPVKFIVTRTALADPDRTANRLRSQATAALGDPRQVTLAVFILGPRQFGGAGALPGEIPDAFEAERSVFEDDPVAGVINVANRLQKRAEAGLLSADEPLPDNGFNWLLYILVPLVLLAGIVAVVLIRRSVARGQAVTSGGPGAPDDDPGSEGQSPDA
jgi:hypothetical protein